MGDNTSPSQSDISDLLESAGVEVDSSRITELLSALKGKDINELITQGLSKLASVPSGGGSASVGASTSNNQSGDKDNKKEEKKEEVKEESDEDMGFGLFD